MITIKQGDCLKLIKDIEVNDKTIFVSDPPFNIGYKYRSYKDRLKENEYFDMLFNLFFDKKLVIIHYPEKLHELSVKFGYSPEKVVSWVYNSNTAKQHRDIAFYKIKPDFSQVRQPYKNLKDKRIQERIKKRLQRSKTI